jgi:hypothetical protein
LGQRARMVPTRRHTKPWISRPLGRLAGRSMAVTTPPVVEDDDWLEAAIVMKGIERAELLAAMQAVEEPAPAAGVSPISSTMRFGRLPERTAVLLDHRLPEVQPRAHQAGFPAARSPDQVRGLTASTTSHPRASSATLNIESRRSVSASLPSISTRNRMFSASGVRPFPEPVGPGDSRAADRPIPAAA